MLLMTNDERMAHTALTHHAAELDDLAGRMRSVPARAALLAAVRALRFLALGLVAVEQKKESDGR